MTNFYLRSFLTNRCISTIVLEKSAQRERRTEKRRKEMLAQRSLINTAEQVVRAVIVTNAKCSETRVQHLKSGQLPGWLMESAGYNRKPLCVQRERTEVSQKYDNSRRDVPKIEIVLSLSNHRCGNGLVGWLIAKIMTFERFGENEINRKWINNSIWFLSNLFTSM